MIPALMSCLAPSSMLAVDSAKFDGVAAYMMRGSDLTGNADSKSGILSVWTRLDGGDGTTMLLFNNTPFRFYLDKGIANYFSLYGANAGGAAILTLTSNTAYTASATWLHILASWDLAASAGFLYVNDVSDLAASPTLTNDTIRYTGTGYGIGTYAPSPGANLWNGCLAELYFAPGQYLDFSVAANRRKFISSTGKPVDLGPNGSYPTGVAPLVFQHLSKGETVSDFANNLGTGGNFTITGSLTTGSSSPS